MTIRDGAANSFAPVLDHEGQIGQIQIQHQPVQIVAKLFNCVGAVLGVSLLPNPM